MFSILLGGHNLYLLGNLAQGAPNGLSPPDQVVSAFESVVTLRDSLAVRKAAPPKAINQEVEIKAIR